jgi:hypothetical protein
MDRKRGATYCNGAHPPNVFAWMRGGRILERTSKGRKVLMQSGGSCHQVERALRISGLFVSLSSVYSDTLHRMILPYPLDGYERKDVVRYRKILDDDESYSVLLVPWKESPFVTDESLRRAGLVRQFTDGGLTAWDLATMVASSKEDLAKTNSRIRSINIAAEAFGLIERGNKTTAKQLVGTELLHQFILAVSETQFRLVAELGPLLSLIGTGFTLPKQ